MPQAMDVDVEEIVATPKTFASAAVLDAQRAGARGKMMSRSERRRANRHSCDVTSACVVISLVEPVLLPVRVRDISQTGVGLLMTARVAPGSFLAVKFQGRHQKEARILRARVIHATFKHDIRAWQIGCYFVEPLRKDDLAGLI